MASTIIQTPSTGSSDWTGWITQQGLTDRGFMRVSLTEFATTAASLIAVGSTFELAGSIYSCTETAISLAAGTASADVAVYYVAIPSAGGTTCTFVMDSDAPTWVDAKQGFYAAADSTSRYLGGAYIGTAASYFNKFIYTPDMVFGYLLPNAATRPILKKVFGIGEWDMDSDAAASVFHELILSRIHNIFALIHDDSFTSITSLNYAGTVGVAGGWTHITEGIITLTRLTDGWYDTVGYNATASTVANRGWVTIEYEA